MFWTDWGTPGKVERSYMDGSERITIADTNLVWPNDITIDFDVSKNMICIIYCYVCINL